MPNCCLISAPDKGCGASNVNRPRFTADSITLEAQKPIPICIIFEGFNGASVFCCSTVVSGSIIVGFAVKVKECQRISIKLDTPYTTIKKCYAASAGLTVSDVLLLDV